MLYGNYISFLDQKSEAIISKYLDQKFLIGNANYSFLFWNIYDAELYSTSNKFNSNEPETCLKIFQSNNLLGVIVLISLLIGKLN